MRTLWTKTSATGGPDSAQMPVNAEDLKKPQSERDRIAIELAEVQAAYAAFRLAHAEEHDKLVAEVSALRAHSRAGL